MSFRVIQTPSLLVLMYMNIKLSFEFVACSVGYYGKNCDDKCPYPFFTPYSKCSQPLNFLECIFKPRLKISIVIRKIVFVNQTCNLL